MTGVFLISNKLSKTLDFTARLYYNNQANAVLRRLAHRQDTLIWSCGSGSCAAGYCEPCQAGNRAALSRNTARHSKACCCVTKRTCLACFLYKRHIFLTGVKRLVSGALQKIPPEGVLRRCRPGSHHQNAAKRN